MSYYDDVGDFHRKFDLAAYPTAEPAMPNQSVLRFRIGFLAEELAEAMEAAGMPAPALSIRNIASLVRTAEADIVFVGQPDLGKLADALADLVWVALGTAHFAGLPFDAVWSEVQRANMTKERATSAADPRSMRAHSLDVVKPAGWTPPNHTDAIALARSIWEDARKAKAAFDAEAAAR